MSKEPTPITQTHTADWYLNRLRQLGPVITEMPLWPKPGFKASVICKAGRIETEDPTLLNALCELLIKTRTKLREHVSRLQG